MKGINFYSDSKYIALPSRKQPRVELAVDSKVLKINSFKLYLPFSKKAKFFKKIAFFLPIFNCFKAKQSDFVTFLEKRYKKQVVTSVYYATDKDKVVLQLQSGSELIGYMKVGISTRGNQRINTELRAFTVLKNDFIPVVIDSGNFNGHVFMLLENINGESNLLNSEADVKLLQLLNSQRELKKRQLKNHPRIQSLNVELIMLNDKNLLDVFNSLNLEIEGLISYEHGDFAPWNILKSEKSIKLIDFEYFINDGVSEFDLIKYHFQIGSLLKGLKGNCLIRYLKEEVQINSFNVFLTLFLLKEIVLKASESKGISLEESLLQLSKLEIK